MFRIVFAIALLCALIAGAQVDPQKLEILAERNDRPTVQELVDTLGIKPGQRLIDFNQKLQYITPPQVEALKSRMVMDLANFVVSLEYYYPGGRYAFLGRDASGAADLVEAFYLSIGQSDRVVRLRSSGASLSGTDYQKNPNQTMVDFLITNGAPLESKDIDQERPFVIVDATSMGGASQSTRLATAGINKLRSLGYTDAQIYPKFAVADISNRGQAAVGVPKSREQFYAQQTARNGGYIYNNMILGMLAPNFSYANVQPEWHNTFTPLQYKPGTREVYTQPGPVSAISIRRLSVQNMVIMLDLVQQPEIRQKVMEMAEARGVSFTFNGKYKYKPRPPGRPKIKVPDKQVARSAREVYQDIEKMTAALPTLPEEGYEYEKRAKRLRLTDNGFKLYQNMQNLAREPELFRAAVPALLNAYNNKKIGYRDFRRLLGLVMSYVQLTDEQVKYLGEKAKEHQIVADLLKRADYLEQLEKTFPQSKVNIKKIEKAYNPMIVSCMKVYPKPKGKKDKGEDKED